MGAYLANRRNLGPHIVPVYRDNMAYGGDEFIALLPLADRQCAAKVANKILSAFEQELEIPGHKLCVGASLV